MNDFVAFAFFQVWKLVGREDQHPAAGGNCSNTVGIHIRYEKRGDWQIIIRQRDHCLTVFEIGKKITELDDVAIPVVSPGEKQVLIFGGNHVADAGIRGKGEMASDGFPVAPGGGQGVGRQGKGPSDRKSVV